MQTFENRWPNYEVADEASVYALGVVSINYARFERTHIWMLAAVANMREDQAAIVSARVNPSERVRLIDTFFNRREWPKEAAVAIKHYLQSMGILIQSRNVLIHSNMVRVLDNQNALFSLSRSGVHGYFNASLADIRRTADDLQTYFQFGLALANYIATEIHHMAREAGMLVISQVPSLPALPIHIDPKQRNKS